MFQWERNKCHGSSVQPEVAMGSVSYRRQTIYKLLKKKKKGECKIYLYINVYLWKSQQNSSWDAPRKIHMRKPRREPPATLPSAPHRHGVAWPTTTPSLLLQKAPKTHLSHKRDSHLPLKKLYKSICFHKRRCTHQEEAKAAGMPIWGVLYPGAVLSLCVHCFSWCFFPIWNLFYRQEGLTASLFPGCGKRQCGRAGAPLRRPWRERRLQHPPLPKPGSNSRWNSPAA